MVAVEVTEEFLRRHRDWVHRYGELAMIRGLEDARFHVDFLAGALESGNGAAFGDYAQWTARVLGSRGIEAHFLIENLEQVRDALRAHLSAEQAAHVARVVDTACEAVRAQTEVRDADADVAIDRSLYLQAIVAGQRKSALRVVLELLDSGRSVADVYCDVLQPAQYEVGRLWEQNRISVAREHAATAITQFVVAQLYSRLERRSASRGPAIVTGVEGELHQLGANMMADVLEAEGWDVRFLGTQMPHRDIMRAIEEHDAGLIGISATMLFSLPRVARLIEDIRRKHGDAKRIVVGGGAFRVRPGIWKEIGADGFGADLREGVAAVETLFPSPN
jgi:methanogenic corrinoid protein MtbC1